MGEQPPAAAHSQLIADLATALIADGTTPRFARRGVASLEAASLPGENGKLLLDKPRGEVAEWLKAAVC